jgi:hypothetical protein
VGESDRSYRDSLVQAHHAASQSFDRAVMALAGGALGVSLTFIHDVAPRPERVWLLGVGWMLLAGSLLVILLTFLTSQRAFVNEIRAFDARSDEADQGGFAGKLTGVGNWAAALMLVGGVVFLVIFALTNLGD